MTNFAASITIISYKEIMIFWGITQDAAEKRLYLIRCSLGKKIFQKLTKPQYCKAEDITTDEFDQAYNTYMNNLHKRTG